MHQQFYSELSELLFVVADLEGLMTRLEKNNLMTAIKDLLFEGGEAPSAKQEITSPKAALNSFLDFIDDNYRNFDRQIREAGAIAARELWHAYEGTSKQEKRLVQELLHKFEL